MINIAYKTVSYGSSGNDVKKLQESLNANGYSLDVDGQFGSKTQAAVKDYQRKNGLSVDGIVGEKTWGALTSKKSNSSSVSGSSSKKAFTYDVKKPTYKKSDSLKKVESAIEEWEQEKPGEYVSPYSDKIDALLDEILGRGDFSYSLQSDPLYEQYRGLYVNNGKKAMRDTVGSMTAMTGGYGNSYALTAGEQVYGEYLQELDDIALELRDRAYGEWVDVGDRLLEDVSLLRSLDGDDYEKYLESIEGYYKDGEYLLKKLANMSDAEFEMFITQTELWESDRKHAFDVYQDALDRDEFDRKLQFQREEARREQANKDREYQLSLKKASSSSSSSKKKTTSSSTKKSKTSENFYPENYNEFVKLTGFAGILTEVEFSMSSLYKETYGKYTDYLKEMYDKHKKE